LGAAALGLSLVLLGGEEPGHESGGRELLSAAIGIAERGAPFLLLGLCLTFFLADRVSQELENLGKSLPLRLARRLGFALGAEGVLLGLSTYGIAWTLAAVLATTLLPLVVGTVAVLAIAIAGEDAAKRVQQRLDEAPSAPRSRATRFDRATAIWVIAVAVAAVFGASLNDGALYGSLGGPGELVVSGGLAALLGTGGPAVVALGALTAKGLSPGAALLAVTVSSALGAKVLLELWRLLGARGVIPVVIWLVCLTAVLGFGINQVAPVARPLEFPAIVGRAVAGLVLLAIVVRAQRVGVRRWLAGWFAEGEHAHHHHGAHEHHGHGHAHSHAHSNEMPNGNAATKRSPDANGPSAEA
jgi:hypothetical protein